MIFGSRFARACPRDQEELRDCPRDGTFISAAEHEWCDVYQVEEDRTKHLGRAQLPRPQWVRSQPPLPPKFPKVSLEAIWLRKLGASMSFASQVGQPTTR
eukprot:6510460-Pyramimonas_sp.AAC.1